MYAAKALHPLQELYKEDFKDFTIHTFKDYN
jgi:hypothetical protein